MEWERLKTGDKRNFCFLNIDTAESGKLKGTKRDKHRVFGKLKEFAKGRISLYKGKEIKWGLEGGTFMFLDAPFDSGYDVYRETVRAGIGILEHLNEFNIHDNILKEAIRLRICIHCGMATFNQDYSLIYGDELSWLIKYEREIGEPNSVVITENVYNELPHDLKNEFPLKIHDFMGRRLYICPLEQKVLSFSDYPSILFNKVTKESDLLLVTGQSIDEINQFNLSLLEHQRVSLETADFRDVIYLPLLSFSLALFWEKQAGKLPKKLRFPISKPSLMVSDEDKKSNLICVGSGKVNLITRELHQHYERRLPMHFDEPSGAIEIISHLSGKKIHRYHSQQHESVGFVEMIENPYNKDKVIIIAAGFSSLGTQAALLCLIKGVFEDIEDSDVRGTKFPARLIMGINTECWGTSKKFVEDFTFV